MRNYKNEPLPLTMTLIREYKAVWLDADGDSDGGSWVPSYNAAMQRFQDSQSRNGGKLHLVGIVSRDKQ